MSQPGPGDAATMLLVRVPAREGSFHCAALDAPCHGHIARLPNEPGRSRVRSSSPVEGTITVTASGPGRVRASLRLRLEHPGRKHVRFEGAVEGRLVAGITARAFEYIASRTACTTPAPGLEPHR